MAMVTQSGSALSDGVRALFVPEVSVAVTDPAADHAPRFEVEARALARAGDSRRREFLAGRAAAHRAMEKMGLRPAPVPAGDDRAPVWPAGLTGSISHSGSACVAVVADSQHVPAVGIDIEDGAPLDRDLVPEICTLPERAWLATRPERMRGQLAKLLFSAKECAYKCQFMLSRELLGFADLEITADLETGQFEATFLRPVPGFEKGTWLGGRYVFLDGHVITAVTAQQRNLVAPVLERRLSFW